MINRFVDDNAFLNDFFLCPVSYQGMSFYNVGQAFAASKSDDVNERLSIAQMGTAREVIAYSAKLKDRPEVEELEIKEGLFRQKFAYPALAIQLVGTGLQQLIDGKDWITNPPDLFWSYDLKRNKGENQNGKLLMKIRSEL